MSDIIISNSYSGIDLAVHSPIQKGGGTHPKDHAAHFSTARWSETRSLLRGEKIDENGTYTYIVLVRIFLRIIQISVITEARTNQNPGWIRRQWRRKYKQIGIKNQRNIHGR